MLKSEIERIGACPKLLKEILMECAESKKQLPEENTKIDPIIYQRNEMKMGQLKLIISHLK